jgi:hypothetical protein
MSDDIRLPAERDVLAEAGIPWVGTPSYSDAEPTNIVVRRADVERLVRERDDARAALEGRESTLASARAIRSSMDSRRASVPQTAGRGDDSESVLWPEVLTEYGLEKLRVQNLVGSLEGQQSARAKDNTTKLSFRTEIPLGDITSDITEGFVMWFNKADLRAALERCKEKRQPRRRAHNATCYKEQTGFDNCTCGAES